MEQEEPQWQKKLEDFAKKELTMKNRIDSQNAALSKLQEDLKRSEEGKTQLSASLSEVTKKLQQAKDDAESRVEAEKKRNDEDVDLGLLEPGR